VTDINFGNVANAISAATNFGPVHQTSATWIDPTQYCLTYTIPLGAGIAAQAGRFVTLLGAEVIPTYLTRTTTKPAASCSPWASR
jgi:hypothetical protein